MGLAERLQEARERAPVPLRTGPADTDGEANDPLLPLKQRTQQALLDRLGTRLYDASLTETQLRGHVQQELGTLVDETTALLSNSERESLARDISQSILGYGPLQPYLDDPDVTEIMVTGTNPIYVERAGRLASTKARFVDHDHLRRIIERIVADVGRRIDESSPMVDARMPDGSRVNAVIPPVSVRGPSLTIRKFARDPFEVDDLVAFGTFTHEIAAFLAACVEGRRSMLISGGTGTGKTTLLNVLSSFIPSTERVVTIEDAVELQLRQEHVVTLEARPANIEGRGEIAVRDLVRNALRMRPDRIIVGEVRGGETLDMLQAMNTGHEGSLSTVHANSPRDAISRLETMVLMAGMDLPIRAVREQVTSAVDVIIQLSRLSDGVRRVVEICEVQGMEGDVVTLEQLFRFDLGAGVDAKGRFAGQHVSTGIWPSFAHELDDIGIQLPVEERLDVDELIDEHLSLTPRRVTKR
jgi:pilus assembly protein CpaF